MLTPKQETFACKIVEGMTQADAYRAAYSTSKMTDKTIWENASRLMADPKVVARVDELRAQIASVSILTAQERLEYLTRVIKGEEKEHEVVLVGGEPVEVATPTAIKTRLNAIDIMNRMTGEYTQKVEADIKRDTTINIVLTDD